MRHWVQLVASHHVVYFDARSHRSLERIRGKLYLTIVDGAVARSVEPVVYAPLRRFVSAIKENMSVLHKQHS